MKVLTIYEHYRKNKGNKIIMNGFVKQMKPLCSEYNEILLPELRSSKRTSIDIYRDFNNIDILICYGNYAPELFSDYFRKMPCAKVIVITDFHGHTGNNPGIMEAYKRNNFDLMIMRGAYDENYKSTIPMIWLPFSSDENRFYPDNKIKRLNIIGFAGSFKPAVYHVRRKAIDILNKNKLLKICSKDQCNKGNDMKNKGYPLFFRSVVSSLTSTELYNWPQTPRAKCFEILASGSVLLTTEFKNIEMFLGKPDINYIQYKNNCSDIVKQAKKIINNKKWANEVAKNGRKVYLKKHTDKIRIKEFYDHLKRLKEGKPIKRIWGI